MDIIVNNCKFHSSGNEEGHMEYSIQNVEVQATTITVEDEDETARFEGIRKKINQIEQEISEEDEIVERKFALMYEVKFGLENKLWNE